jgi:Ni,Fe-hydrogenase I large subunit
MGANYLMSHILHFYHLLALDYVDVNGTGLIPKGFLCPNYDNNYYARGIDPVLQTEGLGKPAYSLNAFDYKLAQYKDTGGTNGPVLGIPGLDWNPNPSTGTPVPPHFGDLTAYFAGQYVRALKFRRMAHQLGALFTGKMPHASSYTPGCVTTKAYDPTPGGQDAAVVQKVHELLYGGPAFDPEAGDSHPYNGDDIAIGNPHPESIMGFVGKPSNFWTWAATAGPNFAAYDPHYLPIWAKAGVPLATGAGWREFTGTYLFDAVAAAHVFPEYFWLGSGYGRFLAWGIFEGADIMGFGDNRLITRGRTHIARNPNPFTPGEPSTPYTFDPYGADHLDVKEFTKHSWYNDASLTKGRHPWQGKTSANENKAEAYTFAKAPRYKITESEGENGDYYPYEVGPLARMLSNARAIGGGPATGAQVQAVDAGTVGLYYPGMLRDVDVVLGGLLEIPGGSIGVMPGYAGNPSASDLTGVRDGTNLTDHLAWAQTAGPVLYLPPNAVHIGAVTNAFGDNYFGDGVLDRVAARALETYFVGMQMLSWFNALTPGVSSNKELTFNWSNDPLRPKLKPQPKRGKGAGLTEAPRGALGHWIRIGKGNKLKKANLKKWRKFRGMTSNYQIITPTAWNISPKDHNDTPGPAEYAMMGTPVVSDTEPIEVLRVIHSFDFCCACTVHVLNAKKEKVFEATIDPTF